MPERSDFRLRLNDATVSNTFATLKPTLTERGLFLQ